MNEVRSGETRRRGWLAAALAAALAMPAGAQVGHLPEKSPYRDLEYTQEWTFFGGSYVARRDPVGVAPQSGTMFGMRWDWRIGGPAYVYGRLAGASLDHRVIDPAQPIGKRLTGTRAVPMAFSDIGLGINLTGFRTWHRLVPELLGGAGMASDVSGRNDHSGFRFGTPFTLTFGGGMKFVPGGKWQLRADWTSYLYQISYPESYFLRVGTDDPVRLPGQAKSMWRRNNAYQIGLSYLYHR